jgi:DmsE family decaheme c-type cytochrome
MPFREGKVTCTDCHNPHGTPNPKLLIESTTNETCYKCHAERRGPFLFEHPPVMENCANCHDPHGTTRPQMLKASAPRLCQQCHIEARHPTTPQLATQRFAFNRGCTNCHSQIHGSNSPSGVRFHR